MNRPICVIGTGSVGLACMAGLAELGWIVNGYDVLSDRAERFKLGTPAVREHDLAEAVQLYVARGAIHFFDSLFEAAANVSVAIITNAAAVSEHGILNVWALESLLAELAEIDFETWPTIVIRSDVLPGTCNEVAALIETWGDLVYAPVLRREVSAMQDFLQPARIVIGARKPSIADPYVRLFESLQPPIVFTSLRNAELVKSCSNAFLALKISYANEVANLCEALGTNADDVLRGIGYDAAIEPDLLQPGIGFGGPRFESDINGIRQLAGQSETGHELLSAVLRVNDRQPLRIVHMLEAEFGCIEGVVLGVWGLAFKAGSDDIRNSPAIRVVEELAARGALLIAYDPCVCIAPLPSGCRLVRSPLEAAHADVLIVLTNCLEFGTLDPWTFAHLLRRRMVIDGCSALDARTITAAGLNYRGIGKARGRRQCDVLPRRGVA